MSKIIFLIFIFVTLFIGSVVFHEVIHHDIMKYHGCKSINIGLKTTYAYTECLEYNNRSEETRLQEWKLHSINEMLGYTINLLIFILFGIKLFNELTKGDTN